MSDGVKRGMGLKLTATPPSVDAEDADRKGFRRENGEG
jgi:hypothetical protein